MKITIIIPAFNEEKKIVETINNVYEATKNIGAEVVVIDDGSSDTTAEKVQSTNATLLRHYRNMGVGSAFQTGLKYALENRSDILINIDADGQFSPYDIPRLIEKIEKEHADLVISNRFSKGRPENMSKVKYWGNQRMNSLIGFLVGTKFSDVSSGFRAYNRRAILSLNLLGDFTYTHEVILNLAMRRLNIVEVPVEVKYFKSRKSRVAGNLLKYVFNSLGIIFKTFRDYKPMRFFGSIGFFIFTIGLFLDSFIVFHYLSTGAFTPYISVALMGAYLNTIGMGVVLLGVIADMFDRHRKNQERILYYQKVALYDKD